MGISSLLAGGLLAANALGWPVLAFVHTLLDQVNLSDIAFTGHDGILVTVWLGISIMVFSFNFSPIVSSFVVSKREEYEPEFGKAFTEQKCSKIIGRASLLMVDRAVKAG